MFLMLMKLTTFNKFKRVINVMRENLDDLDEKFNLDAKSIQADQEHCIQPRLISKSITTNRSMSWEGRNRYGMVPTVLNYEHNFP